ncbi:MAG: RNA polymerase sigma factor [Tepidisphaeraceae bacterium]
MSSRMEQRSSPSLERTDPPAKEPQTPADGDLVRATLAGDRKAFDLLVERYQQQAVAVSYRLLGNRADAVEIVQDSFLKAYTSLNTLQKPDAFAGWAMRIVSNLSLNRRRGRSLRRGASLDVEDAGGVEDGAGVTGLSGESLRSGETDPLRSAVGKELGGQLDKALKQLPEKQRLAILMFTVQELPQKQVAEALECSVEAVKWHVFQGRKKLKELLKEYM